MKTIARFAAAAAAALSLSFAAGAQDYPSNVIRIVVPFPPAGSTDLVGRLLATHLGNVWNQTVVVDNRPGGNGMLGPTYVARSKPDGYTLLLAAPSLATSVASMKVMPIDPEKDLVGVSQLIRTEYVVAVNAKLPVKNVQDFIAYAKANSGKLNYGYFGVGSRLTAEYFNLLTGIKTLPVGYKGEALMVQAVAAGEVQIGIATAVPMRERVGRGELRVLMVTGESRSKVFPDAPTAAEAGVPKFDHNVWFGLFAPAGTSRQIRDKIAAEVAKFVKDPEVIARMNAFGLTPYSSSPDEMSAHVSKEMKRALEMAKRVGLEPQ